jgi:hypothetical protein
MKKVIFVLLAMSMPLFAQTTITTVRTLQDGCDQKSIYCTLAVMDENNAAGQILVDNRSTAQGPLGFLTVSALEFSGTGRGTYTGFHGNPDGTKNPFDGTATYSGSGYDADGNPFTMSGTFYYHAHFVSTCSGRGCPNYGWHFTIKAGSTASVSQ